MLIDRYLCLHLYLLTLHFSLSSLFAFALLLPPTLIFFLHVPLVQVTRLLRSEQKGKVENVQQASVLAKSKMLRMHSGFIPEESFRMRKKFLIDKHLSQGKEKNPMDAMAMMNDPSMFMDMMKKNMVMVVPQMAMMGWVSYFFSGFIVGKMPFPLTDRFKMMLQRGIELSSLDVTYVSSLSLYILCLFGLRGVLTVALGPNDDADDTKIMQQQMTGGMNAQAQDMKKVYSLQLLTSTLKLLGRECVWRSNIPRQCSLADCPVVHPIRLASVRCQLFNQCHSNTRAAH